jgi:hypothetical protein
VQIYEIFVENSIINFLSFLGRNFSGIMMVFRIPKLSGLSIRYIFPEAVSCYPLYLFRQNIFVELEIFRLPKKDAASIWASSLGFIRVFMVFRKIIQLKWFIFIKKYF